MKPIDFEVVSEFVKSLVDAGAESEDLKKITENKSRARQVIASIRQNSDFGDKKITTWDANKLMKMLDFRDAFASYNSPEAPSADELNQFSWDARILYSPCPVECDGSRSVKETHCACLFFSRAHELGGSNQPKDVNLDFWFPDMRILSDDYDGIYKIRKEIVSPGWLFFYNGVVPGSNGHTYRALTSSVGDFKDRLDLSPEDYRIPSVIESVTFCELYKKIHGKYPFLGNGYCSNYTHHSREYGDERMVVCVREEGICFSSKNENNECEDIGRYPKN